MIQRPILLAGNWKMHLGPREAERFYADLVNRFPPDAPAARGVSVVIFPPALSLDALSQAIRATGADRTSPKIELGIQQVHPEPSGAFTGESSAEMAAQAGADYALVGHSERRHIFGESDEDTRARVLAAFRGGLTPVLCVGETLEERMAGRLGDVLRRQLDAVFQDPEVREQGARRGIVVAYEPVWAIGTGETATPTDAGEAHTLIHRHLVQSLGEELGDAIPILYGGSVKPALAKDLLHASHVRGLLVGGASLEPDSWAELMEIATAVAARAPGD
jgi:triosephosphate isomerase